MWIVL